MVKIEGYTAQEVSEMLAPLNEGKPVVRQRVAAIAKAQKWISRTIGTARLYEPSQVNEYVDTRYRTELMRRIGQTFNGNWDNDDYDIACPECNGFAVVDPSAVDRWECWKGHTSK